MLELWIFLNRLSKQGIRSIRGFFNTSLIWLSENEELRKKEGFETINRESIRLIFKKATRNRG
jgi:hypothetical protein